MSLRPRITVGRVAIVAAALVTLVAVWLCWQPIARKAWRIYWGGEVSDAQARGRLSARPHAPGLPAPTVGISRLGLGGDRDGVIYVPPSYRPDRPARVLLMFHGAGGRGEKTLKYLRVEADRLGFIIVSPDSREGTWDVVRHELFGPDVAFVDRALARVFERVAVDPAQLVVGGFSDGATYALSLGLANGDLFARVIAFSPGDVAPGPRVGHPGVFIAHGRADQVLPFEYAQVIVDDIRRDGYDVDFEIFEGGHHVAPEMARRAMDWLGW